MKDNVLLDKSFAFAIRIVNANKFLATEKREYTLSKLLLISGTGIAASVEDAAAAESRPDFFAKLTLAYKDARRTRLWIRLLKATDYLEIKQADSLLEDVEELLKIIGSSQKTLRKSITN